MGFQVPPVINHGICLTIVESAFVTATANRSSLLVGSLLRDNSSPTTAAHVSLYSWYPCITDGTVKDITFSAWRRSNAARVRAVACSTLHKLTREPDLHSVIFEMSLLYEIKFCKIFIFGSISKILRKLPALRYIYKQCASQHVKLP